jgi:hypothetical protein
LDVTDLFRRMAVAVPVAIAISASGAAKAERGIMDYKIYFGGISVVALEIDVERTGRAYQVFSKMRTLGLIHQFFPWTMTGYSRGRFVDGEVQPQSVGHTSNWRGNQRLMEVRYDRGRPMVTRRVPQTDKHERVPVADADIVNTLDLSSAIIAMSLASQTAEACTGHMPVFDGRRRYDMVAQRVGIEAVRRYGRSDVEPNALKCRVTVVRRSGHRKVAANSDAEKINRTGTVWFAPGGDGVPPAPMRIEVETPWGLVIAHLTGVRSAPGKLLN